MSLENVEAYFKAVKRSEDIIVFDKSSATVELAAIALKTQEARIAKTLAFMRDDSPILIVTSGDMKIDNKKYKSEFSCKAKMLSYEDAEELIGHLPGGICPFSIKNNVFVYLDKSLERFESSFPAAGSSNSAIELTCKELETYSQNFVKWVDVCKNK
ncbi:MAG: YbaK/EbsC family protein [Peptostreptococcus sp.]|uniref:YbaK/EbsC family protein n=1 Tax=Peptostreptococcus sp. TaxID=1262 RepID=UPI002FC98944